MVNFFLLTVAYKPRMLTVSTLSTLSLTENKDLAYLLIFSQLQTKILILYFPVAETLLRKYI